MISGIPICLSQSLQIKNLEQFYLSNKLRVVLLHEKDYPLVRMRIVIFTGEASSFSGMEGLATLTARCFFKGSAFFPEGHLSRLLSYHGCKISVEVKEEKTTFSITIPKENFERFLIVLEDLLLRNTFPENALNEERNALIRELRNRKDNPPHYTFAFFYKSLFQKSPYTKIFFTEESLRKVTSQYNLAFLKRYYTPNNSAFIIQGDFEVNNLKSLLEKRFAKWVEKRLFYPYIPPLSPPKESIISILNSTLSEDYFLMGYLFRISSIEERATMLLFNEILGGSEFSRLTLKLKEALGYCRYIGSGVQFLKNDGFLFVAGHCKSEKIRETISNVLTEIKNLKEKRIEERELKSSKDYLIGEIAVRISDPEILLSFLEEAILYNFPLDYPDKLIKGIENCSRENILSIANKYFKIDSNFIVITGRKEHIIDSLSKDFEKIEIYNRINYSWEKEK